MSPPIPAIHDLRASSAADRSSSFFARCFKIVAATLILFATLRISFLFPALPCSMRSLASDPSQTIFLPFVHKFGNCGVPLVRATINGVHLTLPVDTGSTGLLIGAPLLPDISPDEGIPVHHYFTSSNILYKARLVDLRVTFHGDDGASAESKVPVLVVDESVVCPWYDPTKDTFHCPYNPDRPKPTPRDTSKITYMGIGFGRNGPKDGQPSTIPRANPFLNIESVNGKVVSPSSFNVGYTISTDGVHLGLTERNTRGYAFTHLKPGLMHREDPRDWAMVDVCFSVDGEGRNCGSALVDTGIEHMYLRTDIGVQVPNVTHPNPKKNGFAKFVKRVTPGTRIGLEFGNGEVIAESSFAVGDGAIASPAYVVPEQQRPPPFVNTGRNFFYAYSVAFDAIGGRFGFRSKSNGAASLSTLPSDRDQIKSII